MVLLGVMNKILLIKTLKNDDIIYWFPELFKKGINILCFFSFTFFLFHDFLDEIFKFGFYILIIR